MNLHLHEVSVRFHPDIAGPAPQVKLNAGVRADLWIGAAPGRWIRGVLSPKPK